MPSLKHAEISLDLSISCYVSNNIVRITSPTAFSCSAHNPNSLDDSPVFNFLMHVVTSSFVNGVVFCSIFK